MKFNSPALKSKNVFIIFLVTAEILFASISGCIPVNPTGTNITLSEVISLSQSNNIQDVNIDSTSGTMTIIAGVTGSPLNINNAAGSPVQVKDGDQLWAATGALTLADLKGIGFVLPPVYTTNSSGSSSTSTILYIAISIVIIVALFFFLSRAGRQVQNQVTNFSRSRAKLVSGNTPKMTFADVAGADEAKEDLKEVVDFLKNRWTFQKMGATIPKGVLLVGPPGTGKTLLARAVAGEANVPFFSVSGSEFVEMFVGVGAARVRDLFQQAMKNSPCIIFIDEIDAVGRQRAGGIPGSHEEREQTLNQILVEMDGFDPNAGVIVLAATNRVDVLDPALLRPGRFDRRVTLDLPDIAGRKAILQIHVKGKPLGPDADLDIVAKETHGFSGADLANVAIEAAILAVRRKKTTIGIDEFEDAIDRVIAGPARTSIKINSKDRELTAYHEAGHALVAHALPNVDPVRKISIVARGSMGGYTRLLSEDRYFMTASQFKETLATLLAGHASEEMMFNEVSTGPHSDIKQATALARKMVTDFGMSEKLGLRTYGVESVSGYLGVGPVEQRDYSEEIARQIDEEVNKILQNAHQVAKEVLNGNKPRLTHIANKLLAKETLEGPELETAFAETLPAVIKPEVIQGKVG